MISLRSVMRAPAVDAVIVAQREAVRRTACETMDTRREHFVWPTSGRPAFYWYAVEAAAYEDDLLGHPPVIIEVEGFARTEEAAHLAALRAFDEPRAAHAIAYVRRGMRRRHAQRALRPRLIMRVLSTLVLAGMAFGMLGGALFAVGFSTHQMDVQAVGAAAAIGGFIGGGILHYWIEGHR